MHKPRYFLMLAVFVLALGCFLFIGRSSIKQEDLTGYLGMTCLLLALCTAALIEAIQAQSKRIDELERKLAEKQAPADPGAVVVGGRVPGA